MFDFDDLEEQFESAEEEASRKKAEEIEQAKRKKEQEEEDARKQKEDHARKEKERQEEEERIRKEKDSREREEQERKRKEEQEEAQRTASQGDVDKPAETSKEKVENVADVANIPESLESDDKGNKKQVRVDFRYNKQTWFHDFEVPKGSTILHLKKLMTKSDVEEVHWFDLHRNGRPVHSQEQICVDLRLDFEFVGPRTAAKAAEAEASYAKTEASHTPAQVAPTPVASAITTEEASAPGKVDLVVKHAIQESRCVTVSVSASGTVANVRDAVAKELGDTPSNVRIVAKLTNTSGFKSLAPTEKIGTRRQFLAMSEKLEHLSSGASPLASGAGFMEVTVHLDRSRGFKTVAKIKPGSTVMELKEKLAKSDVSGQTRADSFTLAVSSNTPLKPMDDSDKIAEGVTEIDVIVPQAPPSGGQATVGVSQQVEVAVKHAVSGIRIKVKVPSKGKLSDVRDAVATAMGVKPASDIRLVKRMGTGTFASLGPSEPIGERKEFLAMGREWTPMG